MEKTLIITLIVALFLGYKFNEAEAASGGNGKWKLLLQNTGVVAMHMVLTHQNTVVMVDVDSPGESGYHLPRRYNGKLCQNRHSVNVSGTPCYAYSIEYNITRNKIRPLNIGRASTWSSSGSVLSNGTIIQTGGYNNGSRKIRYFEPCNTGKCDWRVVKKTLNENRFYSSSLLLPEGDRVIVVGGTGAFTYEFIPKITYNDRTFHLSFLTKTNERNETTNLYPFLHLSSDGHLFIFSNRDSILLDYKRHRVVKRFPQIPESGVNGSRSYPSTGSSVLLPLDHKDGFKKVEVMVCGGATLSVEEQGNFWNGLSSCGRMVITGNNNKWKMENMPGPRIMNDMILLPTGNILIINGAHRGSTGWNHSVSPSLEPYLYKPTKTLGRRFSVLRSTNIARLDQSSAILLPDGSVLVAGGNPRNDKRPYEKRLQAFSPDYMEREYDHLRPTNVTIYTNDEEEGVGYGEEFSVEFTLEGKPDDVAVSVYAPPFTTHSIAMNQRLLNLRFRNMTQGDDGMVSALVEAPPTANVAPAGYYMISVVNNGIPSVSQWVRFH